MVAHQCHLLFFEFEAQRPLIITLLFQDVIEPLQHHQVVLKVCLITPLLSQIGGMHIVHCFHRIVIVFDGALDQELVVCDLCELQKYLECLPNVQAHFQGFVARNVRVNNRAEAFEEADRVHEQGPIDSVAFRVRQARLIETLAVDPILYHGDLIAKAFHHPKNFVALRIF